MTMRRRRFMLSGASGSDPSLPSFTGNFNLHGDENKGYMELLSGGTLSLNGVFDLCLVGGGQGGYKVGTTIAGADGGSGGKVLNVFDVELKGSIACVIGSGGTSSGNAGSATTCGSYTSANGTTGGKGGTGGSGKGGAGVNPFGDASFTALAGGGGGGSSNGKTGYAGADGGGQGGGGKSNSACKGGSGTANTGGGGGGAGAYYDASSSMSYRSSGGTGGSGVIIVRWGY